MLTKRGPEKAKPRKASRKAPAKNAPAVVVRKIDLSSMSATDAIERIERLRGTRAAKFAISFEPSLFEEVKAAAEKQEGGNVSAWMAEAARRRLRHLAAREALEAFEAEHGVITEEEMAEARRKWQG